MDHILQPKVWVATHSMCVTAPIRGRGDGASRGALASGEVRGACDPSAAGTQVSAYSRAERKKYIHCLIVVTSMGLFKHVLKCFASNRFKASTNNRTGQYLYTLDIHPSWFKTTL